jgi:hypothetical protein
MSHLVLCVRFAAAPVTYGLPMPSTVAEVLAAADLRPAGVVRWGTPVPETAPGVYVVALTEDPDSLTDARTTAPLDGAAFAHLLEVRPELQLDKRETSASALAQRLEAFWLRDEVIVYIGLAGTSLRTRVGQYYKTPLGARNPHAGGWWLKTLTALDDLWVHYATTPENDSAEVAMLTHFAGELSADSRASLHDVKDPAPFANLRTGRGSVKKHGITSATGGELGGETGNKEAAAPEPTIARHRAARPSTHPEPSRPSSSSLPSQQRDTGSATSQPVTLKDIDAGQVRFPRPTKRLLPRERDYVTVRFRGREFERVRWDPRIGADKERSGLLAFGKGKLDRLVDAGEVLTVTSYADGRLELS